MHLIFVQALLSKIYTVRTPWATGVMLVYRISEIVRIAKVAIFLA